MTPLPTSSTLSPFPNNIVLNPNYYTFFLFRYVLTRRVEKLVPLRRLTCIVMPHRGPRASLRQANGKGQVSQVDVNATRVSDFRKMSAIQILKYGLDGNLWKKKGWLFDLLKRDGLSDGSKQSKKELCWSYYKSQMLYIEALQEAKSDSEYDPRRNKSSSFRYR